MNEKVYVIIPVYNGEKYIRRCLDSVFNQTYKNIYVIVVNDGSNDDTLNILNTYNNKNFHVITKDNEGVSVARNTALDFISNFDNDSLIAFIDADDYIDADYIETLKKFIDENDVDIACCSFKYQNSFSEKEYKQIDIDCKLDCFNATNLLVKDKSIQSHSHCKLYKKEVWKNIKYPTGVAWMEDQATIFKTFYNAINGVYISNYCGYHYWQEGESACRSKITNKRIIDSIKGYMEPYNFEYTFFNNKEIDLLKKSASDALADVYLMMIPRINKATLSLEEIKILDSYKKIIKENKIIKKYKPIEKNNKLKRIAFLYAKPFYTFLFKLFKK